MQHNQINVGPVDIHVAQVGEGKPVLFCQGFPDLWIGWRRQMNAVAAKGYRAIAVDMRGYGRSSAVNDPYAYSAFHTVGDLVKLLAVLGLKEVTIVGHDFCATVAWYSAMMRPDIFKAVYCLSVPYLQPSDSNILEQMRGSGRHFYMFDMMKPEAAQQWADASDVKNVIDEFNRTGFGPALNYYRSIEPFFKLARPFRAALIHQPAFFGYGELDGVATMRKPNEAELRSIVPGLEGFLALSGVGHWPQQEAAQVLNETLIDFLNSATA